MNLVLAGAVWCFSVLAGLRLRRRLRLRCSTLCALKSFFETVRLKMEYSASPLLSLLESGTRRVGFLSRCCEAMRAGEGFPDAWKNAVEEAALPLKNDEVAFLLELGGLLGATDLRGQLQILSRASRTMEEMARQAKDRYEKYAPVCTCLGVFTGFAFFVFMT